MTFGENGLVERAEQAKNMTEEASRKEQEGMANVLAYINEVIYGNGSSEETPEVNEEPVINEIEPDVNSVETNTVEPPPVEIPDADGNIQFGEVAWNDGQASVSISTTTEYTIEYQKNGTTGSWTEIKSGEILEGLNSGDIIYVRLTDGENAGKETSITITDSAAPQVTVAPGTITSSTIKVEVEAVDNESGMADEVTYTYYIKKSNEADTAYVNKGSNTNANYTFTGLEQGTSYDIKVEALGDKAGNKGEGTLSSQSTVSIPGGETGLEEGAITFGAPTWSAGTAIVEVSTNTTGYIIEYQVSKSEPVDGSWTTIENNGTISGINHGDTVYARLTDGTNYGEYASATITDGAAPVVEIAQGEVTSNSIAITVNAEDNETGLAESDTYKYYLNEEQEARETSTSNTYTFTGLTAATPYTIRVEVTDKAGNKTEKTTTITTNTATIADIVGGETLTDTTTVIDDSGDEVTIPGGFELADDSPTEADDGIVIQDSDGNQFVWIPVPDYTTMYEEVSEPIKLMEVETTTNVYSKLSIRSSEEGISSGEFMEGIPGTSGDGWYVSEPEILLYNTGSTMLDRDSQYYKDILGYNSVEEFATGIVEEYTAIYESIKTYKGFYIGRYELSGTTDNPTIKKGENVLVEENWYNLKKACTRIVSTEKAQSTMIYGNQWDETMRWLISTGSKTDRDVNSNSNSWGNYINSTGTAATGSGTRRTTGYNEAWKANNIYDLAGNYNEWTQEAYYTFSRICRGGDDTVSGYTVPASSRIIPDPPFVATNASSRVILYVGMNAE